MVGTSSDSIVLQDKITAISDSHQSSGPPSKKVYLAKKGKSVYTLVTKAPTKYTIDIVRMDGKRVFSKSVLVSSKYRLPQLPAGIYLTNINTGTRLETMKLLVTD